MNLNPEQLKQIKEQLIDQINTSFPEERKQETIDQINNMNDSQLIDFLKQNNLLSQKESNSQCIFCSLVFGELHSTKIGENEKAIAILELNPISKGHTIVIPKEHLSNPEMIPTEVKSLAIQIGEKIKETFNPKKVELITSKTMNHLAINILPIYNEETINSERNPKTPEELQKIKEKIENSQTENYPKKNPSNELSSLEIEKREINKENFWLPLRIP